MKKKQTETKNMMEDVKARYASLEADVKAWEEEIVAHEAEIKSVRGQIKERRKEQAPLAAFLKAAGEMKRNPQSPRKTRPPETAQTEGDHPRPDSDGAL